MLLFIIFFIIIIIIIGILLFVTNEKKDEKKTENYDNNLYDGNTVTGKTGTKSPLDDVKAQNRHTVMIM